MDYQKMINLSDNIPSETSKFRTKIQVEINDNGRFRIKFTLVADVVANNVNKKVTFKNSAPFTDYINEINNVQVDSAKDQYVVMLMYNLIEYWNNYSKASGSLWKYCKTSFKNW